MFRAFRDLQHAAVRPLQFVTELNRVGGVRVPPTVLLVCGGFVDSATRPPFAAFTTTALRLFRAFYDIVYVEATPVQFVEEKNEVGGVSLAPTTLQRFVCSATLRRVHAFTCFLRASRMIYICSVAAAMMAAETLSLLPSLLARPSSRRLREHPVRAERPGRRARRRGGSRLGRRSRCWATQPRGSGDAERPVLRRPPCCWSSTKRLY